jgi:putative ABC transport system permease protein
VTVLKGAFQRSGRGEMLRKGLVVFQFTASAALITGTLIVSRQLKFMNDADLGISLTDMIVVEPPTRTAWDSTFIQRVEAFKAETSRIPAVLHVTTSNHVPGARLGRTFDVHMADQGSESHYTMSFLAIDYSFMDTYQVPLVAGRNFEPTDHHFQWEAIRNVIMNIEGVRLLGFREASDAVGKEINFWDKTWTIVGVVADFHQQALKRPIEPMLFFPSYGEYNQTSIKIRRAGIESAISSIEKTYKQMFPGNAFQYYVLEDSFNRQYSDDNRFGQVVRVFTVLAILIACLGLIGLSSYTALQRTKEIGIRKVLGASVFGIVALLSSGYSKLIGVASLLAVPIAFYSMQKWLSGYIYRIELDWTLFVWPVLLIIAIAATTVGLQLLRAATRNPATTLRHE